MFRHFDLEAFDFIGLCAYFWFSLCSIGVSFLGFCLIFGLLAGMDSSQQESLHNLGIGFQVA